MLNWLQHIVTRPAITLYPLPQNAPPSTRRRIPDGRHRAALRSTRNRLRTAMHRRCIRLRSRLPDDGADARARRRACRVLARDLPEAALHVASRRPTTQPSAASLTCAVVRGREALHGVVNPRRINGMQGVRGSNPLSSTPGQRPSSASTALESPTSGSNQQQSVLPGRSGRPTRPSAVAVVVRVAPGPPAARLFLMVSQPVVPHCGPGPKVCYPARG